MELILREDVYNLGHAGELVSVKNGYARNYLLPRNLAMLASEGNKRQLSHEKSVIDARMKKLKGAAEAMAKTLGAVSLRITRKVGDQDKLYGSVTSLDVAEALAKAGHKLDRRIIHLPNPIKSVGTFDIPLHLHREVQASVKLEVAGDASAA